MEKNKNKLTFVYNADSSVFAQVSDAIKKITTPDKYQCNLCMVTYGAVSMKDEWKEFLDTLPFEKLFLHRDEFHKKFPELENIELPIVLISNSKKPEVLLSAKNINDQKNLQELINILSRRLDIVYPQN